MRFLKIQALFPILEVDLEYKNGIKMRKII
jgi:hypothetical protein